ncbi:hypothetical protein HDU85_000696 [Gaertneriomyces sp. JEL0708]|nr:hypothetical protein HDU85_000696 [Gaertneriomyces sp. JEL0708]
MSHSLLFGVPASRTSQSQRAVYPEPSEYPEPSATKSPNPPPRHSLLSTGSSRVSPFPLDTQTSSSSQPISPRPRSLLNPDASGRLPARAVSQPALNHYDRESLFGKSSVAAFDSPGGSRNLLADGIKTPGSKGSKGTLTEDDKSPKSRSPYYSPKQSSLELSDNKRHAFEEGRRSEMLLGGRRNPLATEAHESRKNTDALDETVSSRRAGSILLDAPTSASGFPGRRLSPFSLQPYLPHAPQSPQAEPVIDDPMLAAENLDKLHPLTPIPDKFLSQAWREKLLRIKMEDFNLVAQRLEKVEQEGWFSGEFDVELLDVVQRETAEESDFAAGGVKKVMEDKLPSTTGGRGLAGPGPSGSVRLPPIERSLPNRVTELENGISRPLLAPSSSVKTEILPESATDGEVKPAPPANKSRCCSII